MSPTVSKPQTDKGRLTLHIPWRSGNSTAKTAAPARATQHDQHIDRSSRPDRRPGTAGTRSTTVRATQSFGSLAPPSRRRPATATARRRLSTNSSQATGVTAECSPSAGRSELDRGQPPLRRPRADPAGDAHQFELIGSWTDDRSGDKASPRINQPNFKSYNTHLSGGSGGINSSLTTPTGVATLVQLLPHHHLHQFYPYQQNNQVQQLHHQTASSSCPSPLTPVLSPPRSSSPLSTPASPAQIPATPRPDHHHHHPFALHPTPPLAGFEPTLVNPITTTQSTTTQLTSSSEPRLQPHLQPQQEAADRLHYPQHDGPPSARSVSLSASLSKLLTRFKRQPQPSSPSPVRLAAQQPKPPPSVFQPQPTHPDTTCSLPDPVTSTATQATLDTANHTRRPINKTSLHNHSSPIVLPPDIHTTTTRSSFTTRVVKRISLIALRQPDGNSPSSAPPLPTRPPAFDWTLFARSNQSASSVDRPDSQLLNPLAPAESIIPITPPLPLPIRQSSLRPPSAPLRDPSQHQALNSATGHIHSTPLTAPISITTIAATSTTLNQSPGLTPLGSPPSFDNICFEQENSCSKPLSLARSPNLSSDHQPISPHSTDLPPSPFEHLNLSSTIELQSNRAHKFYRLAIPSASSPGHLPLSSAVVDQNDSPYLLSSSPPPLCLSPTDSPLPHPTPDHRSSPGPSSPFDSGLDMSRTLSHTRAATTTTPSHAQNRSHSHTRPYPPVPFPGQSFSIAVSTSRLDESDESESDEDSTSEDASDDSDDVPLGQRHPDALRAQASLREERARRKANRESIKAAPSNSIHSSRKIRAEQAAPQQAHEQRQNDLASATAKLTVKTSAGQDDDDNKPLGLIKRQKTITRASAKPHEPFGIIPEDLTRRLELLQRSEAHRARAGGLAETETLAREPIGHPLLPQTDASVRSRKQSSHGQPLEPLSPYVQESVLTMGDELPSVIDHTDNGSVKHRTNALVGFHHHPEHHSRVNQPKLNSSTDPSPRLGAGDGFPAPSESNNVTLASHPGLKRGQTLAYSHTISRRREPVAAGVTHSTRPALESKETTTVNLSRAKTGPERKVPINPSSDASPQLGSSSIMNPNGGQSNPAHLGLARSKSTSKRPPPLLTNLTARGTHDDQNMPSLPPQLSPTIKKQKLLIKVGIVDRSQSIMVEIDEESTVKDLLREAEFMGGTKTEKMTGSWGVFEVWKELGIERPIREAETIMSVVKTWTGIDTNETHLLIQKNDLSGLAVTKRSVTSGMYGGNLWCELKPGKWTKKYVLLRDNGVYLCSNEKGKDEMFLCTMLKFDVYHIPSWAHANLKAPRSYAFGLKSLDKLSFFETKSDFVHKFCCKERLTQLEWIRRLYDARTFYVMSQSASGEVSSNGMTRHKLSDPPGGRTTAERTKGGLTRAGTLVNPNHGGDFMRQKSNEGASTEMNRLKISNQGNETGLTRKPSAKATLISGESLSKFRQGTLLGNLGKTSNEQSSAIVSSGRAILPSHITPLSPQEMENKNDHKTVTTVKLRTWEQMGPLERKEYLAEVESRAKLEGRTLLTFESKPAVALMRSKTLGGPGGSNGRKKDRNVG